MSVDIDVDDFVEDFADRLREFLQEREREYRERAKMGVKMSMTWGGYNVVIGGHEIHIEHDSSRHRWIFRDERYAEFFNISEKKGEAIVEFLKALAKITSHPEASWNEDIFTKDPNEETLGDQEDDLAAEGEDTFAEDRNEEIFSSAGQDRAADDDEIFGEEEI